MNELDTNALIALDVLLATRSVTIAARQLGVSQSAMSHRLRQLRDPISDPLLVGGRNGLVLTARAEAIREPLRRAIADLRAAVRVGEPFDPKHSSRRFVVATSDYGELAAVPTVMRHLRSEAPHISIAIEPLDLDVPTRLASGAVDIAVTVPSDLPPSLKQKTIARETFSVALRRGHPALREKKELSLETYIALDHILVAPRGLPGSIVDAALAKRGLTRRIALRLPNFVSVPFVVATTDLVSTLGGPLLRAASAHSDIEIVPPPIPLPMSEIVMVWHERAQLDPGHTWLRRIVENSLADESEPQTTSAPRTSRKRSR